MGWLWRTVAGYLGPNRLIERTWKATEGAEEAYGAVARRRGRSEGGAPRAGRRSGGGRRRCGSVSRRIRMVVPQTDSRYGEEVVVGVGGASGLARIGPGRP